MTNEHHRMNRERKTVKEMIKLFCKNKHNSRIESCKDCNELLEYAMLRLDKCPYQENKPTCSNCSIHCYNPEFRTKIRAVMRYSGPRMLFKHPILAIRHLIDGSKSEKLENKN